MDSLPLGHFRLLYLEPSHKDSPIRCRLVTFDLQSAPTYEALSYTWGALVFDHEITCNDLPLRVTANLYEALHYLRQSDVERIMWIDAVCIDQTNLSERTAQVRIMKDIYSKSDHTVIWLGKETNEDVAAFAVLERFRKLFAEHGQLDIGPMETIAYRLPLPEEDSRDWTALVKLFQKPWFERIWVVQEAVMAQRATVACGPFSASWDLLCDVADSVLKSGKIGLYLIEPHAPGVNSARVIRSLKNAHQSPRNSNWKLIQLLRTTRKYQASDPRDKVFALQGVVTDTNSICNTVDYGSTVEEVYLAVAVHTLQERKDLTCLSNAGLSTYPQKPNLPSWVPDWSHDNNRKEILAATNQFRASGDTLPTLSISSDHKVLIIQGFVIDTVAHVDTTRMTPEKIHVDPTSKEAKVRPMLEGKVVLDNYIKLSETAHRFPPDQDREEALWRTLCCDLSVGRSTTRAPEEYAIGYRVLRRLQNILTPEGEYDWEKDPGAKSMGLDLLHLMPFVNSVMRLSIARKRCVTSSGYLGRVTHGSVAGDKICILFGASVPFVLREKDNGEFTFIGEAYVHGIMDGEALKEYDVGNLTQDFKIC